MDTPKSSNQHQSKFDNSHHPLIVLDTSVILKAISFNKNKIQNVRTYAFLEQNKDRIKVPATTKHEVDEILPNKEERTSEMQEKMELFEGKEVDSSHHAITKVNEMHEYARNNADSDIADKWLRSKRKYLKKKYPILFDTKLGGSYSVRRERQLGHLYEDAEDDRRIMAQALVLAEQEDVILISDDRDITLFGDELSERARYRLQVGDISNIPACELEKTAKSLCDIAKKEGYCFCDFSQGKKCNCGSPNNIPYNKELKRPTAAQVSHSLSGININDLKAAKAELGRYRRPGFEYDLICKEITNRERK